MIKSSVACSVPLLLLNLACAAPTMAEEIPAASTEAAKPAAKDDGVPVVVVTSQRRAVKVQDIPIAETVLTGDQLKEKAVVRLADLATAAPALTITDNGLVASVNVRGIGLASGSGFATNGVATYVDGLFQAQIITTPSFYDIGNIEILRGPQGTLVGSNSTGGALLITTQNPKLNALEGYGELGIGTYKARSFQGAINVPLSDTLAIRIAANHSERDSYYTDYGPFHNKAGMLDENAARIGLLLKTGKFQALLKLDYLNKKTGGMAFKPVPGSANDVGQIPGIYNLNYNSRETFDEYALMTGLELRYETDSGIVLRSLSGIQKKRVSRWTDLNANPTPGGVEYGFFRNNMYTQELNVISPATGRFSWILGAYFQKNVLDIAIHQDVIPDVFNLDVTLPGNLKFNRGVFAQTAYKLTDDLEVQFGVRESNSTMSGVGQAVLHAPFFPPNFVAADLSGNYSDRMPTGKLSLDWKADKDNMVYGFVARGYKGGSYLNPTAKAKPETVLNYELGWKSTMADGHVRTQFDVFYNDYRNFQLDSYVPGSGMAIVNLPPSISKGVEGQIQAKLKGFGFDAGFAYVNSKMGGTRLIDGNLVPSGESRLQCAAGVVSSSTSACFDYSPYTYISPIGPNLMSPKLTYNFGAEYKFNLPNDTSLTPRLNVAHVGGNYLNATYLPSAYIPERTTMSALVTWRAEDWAATLYGNNLTGKQYITGQANGNLFYGAPREYGVRVTRDF